MTVAAKGRANELTIVENEVDASQLLESLEGHSGKLALDHVSTEAVDVARLSEAHLVLVVRANLSELGGDGWVVGREPSKVPQSTGGLLPLALLDQITRRLGQNEHATDEDDRPGELHCNRDTVGSGIAAVGRSIVHDSRQEKTDGNCPLICAYYSSSDPLWRRL